MKKVITMLSIAAALTTGGILTGCNTTPAQKEDAAQQKVDDAKQDLKDVKQDAQNQLNAEYPAFKTDGEAKIAANEKRIAELKAKLAKPGKAPLDDARAKRIQALEDQNAQLRSELYGYEKERSDWETFKAKFNHDVDNLNDAFKDFGKDLKK